MAVSSPLGRWRASARREPLHPSLSASDSRQHDSGGSAGDGEERRHRPSRRERGKDQSRRVGLSAGLRPHDGAAGNYGVPLQVRDVSGLGARHGLLPAVRMDHSENNARPRVRSLSSLGCESSKRIQTGEPNELATNSRSFWLAARCPGLAGNGQYCGETVALWYGNIAHRSKPDAPLSHSWATFSVSPTGRALLVNGSAGTSFVIGPESQD